ncbi:MAG: CHAT domain-containing protein [Polyangiales bacterium]
MVGAPWVEFELVIRGAAGAYTIELRGNDLWGPMDAVPFLPPGDLPGLLQRVARCRRMAEQRSGAVRDAEPALPPDDATAPDEAGAQDPLDALGRMLAGAIFQGEIRSRYDRALGTGRPLRIRLHVPGDLAQVPWEVTRTADGREFIALSGEQHIVRVSDAARAPSTVGGSKLRVLALAATPRGLPGLSVDAEGAWLRGVLDPLVREGLVEVTWIANGRDDELRSWLIDEAWDVFHFAGHGEAGSISCCGPDQEKVGVSSEELARLLKRRGIGLVVLNSCRGAAGGTADAIASTARVLSERAVPAVVAMQYAISDAGAVEFTRWFYKALAARRPIEDAVAEARDALARGGGAEWPTPVLYLNRADGVLFEDEAARDDEGGRSRDDDRRRAQDDRRYTYVQMAASFVILVGGCVIFLWAPSFPPPNAVPQVREMGGLLLALAVFVYVMALRSDRLQAEFGNWPAGPHHPPRGRVQGRWTDGRRA